SSRTKMIVVSAATTSTTNMTELLISVRGSSLTKAEPTAGHTIFGSNRADTGIRLRVVAISSDMDVTPRKSDQNSDFASIAKCSATAPSASAGKNVRPPTIMITPTSNPTKSGPCVGNVPADAGTIFFATSEPPPAALGMEAKGVRTPY